MPQKTGLHTLVVTYLDDDKGDATYTVICPRNDRACQMLDECDRPWCTIKQDGDDAVEKAYDDPHLTLTRHGMEHYYNDGIWWVLEDPTRCAVQQDENGELHEIATELGIGVHLDALLVDWDGDDWWITTANNKEAG